MSKPHPSEDTLLLLNEQLEQAIKRYLPEPERRAMTIRFDLPEQEHVDAPTISVFLYDIQEDLQLRSSGGRCAYSDASGGASGYVQVRCCYLITYWDGSRSGGSPVQVGARSDAMRRMNYVLNALVNHRSLPDMPQAYCRVLPPAEHLNSLGGFWQSLGNKPRLSLSYMVTVPICLTQGNAAVGKILSTHLHTSDAQKVHK